MKSIFSGQDAVVKADFESLIHTQTKELLEFDKEGASMRQLEERVWTIVLAIGRFLLTSLIQARCRRAMERDIEARGLSERDVSLRTDRNYWKTLQTTFGSMPFT